MSVVESTRPCGQRMEGKKIGNKIFWRRLLQSLLVVSLAAFACDLFHMGYHLAVEPLLWRIPGVPGKLALKFFCLMIPLMLLVKRRIWLAWLLLFFLFNPGTPDSWAASRACQHARELLKKSGMARDAKENLFGQIKLSPPYGSFPPDMDKLTWWGQFQPFEFWESPEFQAVWIDPSGREAARQEFRPGKCELAKTSIQAKQEPRGEFTQGMWNVIVTCEDYLVDKQNFAVLPSESSPVPAGGGQDSSGKSKEDAMIWARDEVK